jgi:signal transduction histidine kinase
MLGTRHPNCRRRNTFMQPNEANATTTTARRATLVLYFVTALVFLLDVFTPLGINDGYFYAISILVTLWIPGRTVTFVMGGVAVILIVIAFYVGLNERATVAVSVINRLFAVMGIFITAFAVLKNKEKEKMMSIQNAELKLNMERLNNTNAQLEQYAYLASHDLQEPLRKITSYISLLRRRIEKSTDRETMDFLNVIVSSAHKMRALIKSFLLFSQIGKNRQIASVDTGKLVARIIAEMQQTISEHNAKIEVGYLPVIQGVETELRQLFQNMIINAIKFRRDNVPPEIVIQWEDKITEWQFSVKDNGIGIKQEYFDKIFVIFQRLHVQDEYPGLGVGLAICKKIADMNEGRIWLESRPGEGSTFHFTISKSQK